jgi:hypothetical protein
VTLRDRRAAGASPADLLLLLARLLDLPERRDPAELARAFDRRALVGRREVRLPPA